MIGPIPIRTLLPMLVIASLLAVPLTAPGADTGDPVTNPAIGVTPTFRYWGVFNSTGTNVTNGQVDVGTSVFFNVTVGIIGLPNLDFVRILGWYDDGNVSESTGTSDYNQTAGSNLNFVLRWVNTTGNSTFTIRYPGSDHVSLVNSSEKVTGPNTIALSWEVRFAELFRWSPGDAGCPSPCGDGIWTPNPTPRSKATSFNDLNSFNLQFVAVDNSGNQDRVWDEFGFYRHSELGIGGDPFGFGTPGSGRLTLSTTSAPATPTNVSFRSNAPHRLSVAITDPANGTDTIAADQVGIKGGQIPYDTGFIGAGVPLYLRGSATGYAVDADNPYPAEPGGPFDYGEATWFLTIPPGTPDGTFVAAITYQLNTNSDPNGLSTVPETFAPPVIRTIRLGSTTVGSGDVTYVNGTSVPVSNLVQVIDASDGTTVYASWPMGDGTTSGPPLFTPLAGEFDSTVSLDPDLFPLNVRIRVFDMPGSCGSVFGLSDPFIITGATAVYDLAGFDLDRSC